MKTLEEVSLKLKHRAGAPEISLEMAGDSEEIVMITPSLRMDAQAGCIPALGAGRTRGRGSAIVVSTCGRGHRILLRGEANAEGHPGQHRF